MTTPQRRTLVALAVIPFVVILFLAAVLDDYVTPDWVFIPYVIWLALLLCIQWRLEGRAESPVPPD